MKITIKDRKFGQENYECNVFIDGVKQEGGHGRHKEITCSESCEVRIEYINKTLREKHIALMGLFYWIVSLLGGSNEPHPFGIPYNAFLVIRCSGDKDIIIETNAIWRKEPFRIIGECEVEANVFTSAKGYKKKWFFLEVIPLSLLMVLIFMIFFIGLGEFIRNSFALKMLMICVTVVVEAVWWIYVYNVMKK